MNDLVTVCIPTYNRKNMISRTVISALSQTYSPIEVLIIDDGSQDGTDQVIKQLRGQYPNKIIKYYYKENGGKYTALNSGIRLAAGEFFLILDSDDTLLPNAIEILMNVWRKIPEKERPQYCGIMGRYQSQEGTRIGKAFPKMNAMDFYKSNYIDFHWISGPYSDCCELLKSEIIKQYSFPETQGLTFFPEAYLMDQIGIHYKLACINTIVGTKQYVISGITKNFLKVHINNAGNMLKYYGLLKNFIEKGEIEIPAMKAFRIKTNYYRYTFHCHQSIHKYNVIFLCAGYGMYLRDRYILKKLNN